MPQVKQASATLEDLHREPGKAELIGGRIVRFMATGFKAEVLSENNYGGTAEEELAEKRSDYFAAGTLVVWDVDPIEECIHVYRATNPVQPTMYRRGQMAEAEPAVLGWRVEVDWIFATRTSQ